ncbi:ABC transporter substrate-binding protein [Nocardia arthritidis]|uniref:ABC transporter substrate-binding protein n=1 Tax=Nocardia arthritidis TaxID=228602 RepID=A0A6G9YNN8_9NOCA|nr:ABC transporter substrate-binding protein [Nocardia arthritidis]QIS14808.1 ABC transporter substrate-binding protein [Nocardia arthritidis]
MPVSAFVRTRIRQTIRTRALPRRGLAVTALAAVLLVAGCSQKDDSSSIVRTTTNIAGADVIGIDRDTTHACALPSAPDPASGRTRTVTHIAGVSEVPADPQRIVVLTTAALDASCALGLWERVVGAVTIDGPHPQPQYLGYGVDKIPSVGTAAQPDLGKIAALHPDLIIGDIPTATIGFDALRDIAPTVLIGRPGNWQAEFSAIAAGLGRRNAAAAALDSYHADAKDVGNAIWSNQTQASIIRFGADSVQVQGSDSFAAQVLADAGAQRPTAQRGPSFDVSTSDFTKIEGDLIYILFAGDAGKKHAEQVLREDEWKNLSAALDRRTFIMDDEVWHGDGLTAARALLTDIRNTLNGFVTS